MQKQTLISISAETKERFNKFKEKYSEAKNDDELLNDMIIELEDYFAQKENIKENA